MQEDLVIPATLLSRRDLTHTQKVVAAAVLQWPDLTYLQIAARIGTAESTIKNTVTLLSAYPEPVIGKRNAPPTPKKREPKVAPIEDYDPIKYDAPAMPPTFPDAPELKTAWVRYAEMRHDIRKDLTPAAIQIISQEMRGFNADQLVQIFNQATMNQRTALYTDFLVPRKPGAKLPPPPSGPPKKASEIFNLK
jgi:hypothetical protein